MCCPKLQRAIHKNLHLVSTISVELAWPLSTIRLFIQNKTYQGGHGNLCSIVVRHALVLSEVKEIVVNYRKLTCPT